MAPKKKGGKKAQNDDWENEVAETPDSIAQATAGEEATDPSTEVNPDEEFGGGGILAALKAGIVPITITGIAVPLIANTIWKLQGHCPLHAISGRNSPACQRRVANLS